MLESQQIADAIKMMNKAAVLELAQLNHGRALEIFTQERILEEQLRLKTQTAETTVNIANIHYLMQDYEAALAELDKAQDLFRKDNNPLGVFKTSQLRGAVYFQKRDYSAAAQAWEMCIRMNLGGEETATAYFQAAVAYMKQNNNFRAQEYLGRALGEFERNGNQTGAADCLRQRAALFKHMGRKDLASNDLRRCLNHAAGDAEMTEDINRQIKEL